MFDIVATALTVVVIGFLFYLSSCYVCEKMRLLNGHKPITFSDEARYNKKLDQIMFDISQTLHASNVFLARLHNNGHWNNGRSMKKFTVILEKITPMAASIQQDYKDVLCSRYPEAMDFLFYHGLYLQADLSLCQDKNLKRDLQTKHEYNSVYMFLIRQANGEKTEEAFIGILYRDPVVLDREKMDYVKSLRFDILGLLNMTKKI